MSLTFCNPQVLSLSSKFRSWELITKAGIFFQTEDNGIFDNLDNLFDITGTIAILVDGIQVRDLKDHKDFQLQDPLVKFTQINLETTSDFSINTDLYPGRKTWAARHTTPMIQR